MNQEKSVAARMKKHLWLVFMCAGGLGSLSVYLLMPHKGYIDSIFQMLYKLLAFFLVVVGISLFPNRWAKRHLLLLLVVVAFLSFFIPKLSFWGFVGIPQNIDDPYNKYYTYLFLMLYPAVLLSICFAYRIGGGKPGHCIKIGLFGVLLLFSGYYDLFWFVVNRRPFPETLPYAHHIMVVIGHYPTTREAFLFFLCHVPFLVGIVLLPLERWISRFHGEDASSAETRGLA
jgi:hypothetical protein